MGVAITRRNGPSIGSGVTPCLDITYCDLPGFDRRLTSLDIYSPAAPNAHPVVIYVHGGAWREGDKSEVGIKPNAFAGAGYLFVSTNYRLHPRAKFPAQAQDLAKAIAYVHDRIGAYGGDPTRIHLLGSSSGAHLVSLVACDCSYLEAEGLAPRIVTSVVSLDTRAYDIPDLMVSMPRGSLSLYRDVFGDDRASWERASPARHVASGKAIPPFLLAYTRGDPTRELQAKLFAKRLQDAGIQVKVLAATDKTHAGLDQDIGKEGDPVSWAVLDFMAWSERFGSNRKSLRACATSQERGHTYLMSPDAGR